VVEDFHRFGADISHGRQFQAILVTAFPRAGRPRSGTEGEKMVVVPLPQPENEYAPAPRRCKTQTPNWVRFVASGTLVAGGLLLLNGRRRAGLAVAASGTALAMLDQKEVLRALWNEIPGYIDDLQGMLGKVQGTVDELSAQRERLHRILSK
jgi:hypothetical protein